MFKLNSQNTDIYYGNKRFIKSIKLETNVNGTIHRIDKFSECINDDTLSITFKEKKLDFTAELTIKNNSDTLLFSIKSRFDQQGCYRAIHTVDSKKGFVITLETANREKTISKFAEDENWTFVGFNNKILPDKTQGMIFNSLDTSFCALPLCTEKFTAQLGSDSAEEIKLYLGAKCEGYNDMSGDILVISADANPYNSIEKAVKECCETEFFVTPLRSDKKRPIIIDGLGWCTWDACYFDVTQDKLRAKMEEFRSKNIIVNWVLIDDGWFSFNGKRITDLYADKQKFPNGLKGAVDMLKNEYGVKYVGLWHSFNAYWYGFDENGKAYAENKDLLIKTKGNVILPDYTDTEKAFKFFDKWHTYMKNEGIDFLKIDTQGTLSVFTDHNISHAQATRNIQLAVEKSVKKHFDGELINCMGTGMENTQSRPYSNMLRNSNDFWPNIPNSFKKHIIQNAYNAIFNHSLYYLDFDMWWTNNNFAEQSAVLRAISGGPVYISDEIGATNLKYIVPLMDEKGKVAICDDAAMPTPDCLFNDSINNNAILKLWNSLDDVSIVSSFNISSKECVLETEITYADIKNPTANEYVAYFYFEKKFVRFNKNTSIKLRLKKDRCEIINFYPIVDETIMLGDTSKYISAGFSRKRANISDINFTCEETLGIHE